MYDKQNLKNILIRLGLTYAVMEASGVEPGLKAQIISPPLTAHGLFKCLSFKFNIYGAHSGTFSVLDENFEPFVRLRNSKWYVKILKYKTAFLAVLRFVSILDSVYSVMNQWNQAKMDIPGEWRRFVIEAVRGGRSEDEDLGDMAVDDFVLELSRCSG